MSNSEDARVAAELLLLLELLFRLLLGRLHKLPLLLALRLVQQLSLPSLL